MCPAFAFHSPYGTTSPCFTCPLIFLEQGVTSTVVYRFVENLLCFGHNMQVFKSPFKGSSSKVPSQDPLSFGSGSAVLDTSQMTADEMRALPQSQQEAIGGPRGPANTVAVHVQCAVQRGAGQCRAVQGRACTCQNYWTSASRLGGFGGRRAQRCTVSESGGSGAILGR